MIGAKGVLEGLSALFALGAAIFWFLSARVYLPPLGPVSGRIWEPEESTKNFHEAVRQTATLSQWAASCAAVAAGLQAITLFPPDEGVFDIYELDKKLGGVDYEKRMLVKTALLNCGLLEGRRV